MGQVLHGSARTTPAARRLIQQSPQSLQSLATRHGVNPKTVAKWRSRATTADAPMGPKPAPPVGSAGQEAMAVAFRRHALLPLDDGRYALPETIPPLARPALPRLFRRHGTSRLPALEPWRRKRRGRKRSSRTTPSAACTWTLPRCAPKKAASVSSWPLTAPASGPLPNYSPAPPKCWRLIFCAGCWPPCPTRSIKCGPTTAPSLATCPTRCMPGGTSSPASATNTASRTALPSRPAPGPTGRSSASTARSKQRPCTATTTRPRPSSTSTCRPFYWPTTTPGASNG